MSHLELVALVVKEYEPVIDFFVNVMGFELVESVGKQFGGRVGFFLRVDDFGVAYQRMVAAGVSFVSGSQVEPYGQVAVFLDLEGNRWDLLG